MKHHIILIISAIVMFSCENPLESGDIPGGLLNSSLSLFSGEVQEAGNTRVDGTDLWKVKIKNDSGAVTTFYWRKTFNNIHSIVGEQGPFDYELRPPLDVINFSTARFLAFNQSSFEPLETWSFFRNQTDSKWYYQFNVSDGILPITIDAASGTRIR